MCLEYGGHADSLHQQKFNMLVETAVQADELIELEGTSTHL